MADADDVRRLALALPGVEEIDSDGFDFRVGGKEFVWSYPERRPGKPRLIRTDVAVLFVGDEAEKQALLLGEPGTFFTTPGYDGWPLVMLRLAEADAERLAELVTDAWRMRAPEALAGPGVYRHGGMGPPGRRQDLVRAATREGRLLHSRGEARRRGKRSADPAARDRRRADGQAAARDGDARGHLRGRSARRRGGADELLHRRLRRDAGR